jgi:hypothetical protein
LQSAAGTATAVGSDLSNQMGVGHHSYHPDFGSVGRRGPGGQRDPDLPEHLDDHDYLGDRGDDEGGDLPPGVGHRVDVEQTSWPPQPAPSRRPAGGPGGPEGGAGRGASPNGASGGASGGAGAGAAGGSGAGAAGTGGAAAPVPVVPP